jgi:Na+-transporting methylmalonyl-CoA/oxaloacetate decarboxylase gamma subunit
VNLNDAAPKLLEVYLKHERVAFRMMALAALHAIGDEDAMQTLNQVVRQEASERVRRVTVAALHDHYHQK